MRFHGKPATLALAALLLLPPAGAYARRVERLRRVVPASGAVAHLDAVSGSALVRFRAGVSTAAAAAQLAPAGFSIARTFGRFNWSIVAFSEDYGVQAGLDFLKALPAVDWAEPNRVYRPHRVPADPYVNSQYALARVQAYGAWEYETGVSSRVTVAVIDTGIDGSHPELAGKLSGVSRAFTPEPSPTVSDDQPPTAACNHATRVAGVAAAASDNSAGVAGVSWGARLISMKVFSDSGCTEACADAAGLFSCSTDEGAIAAAVNELIPLHNTPELGKVVINISLGAPGLGGCSTAMQNAVNAATGAGLMVFAAAGNEGAPVIDSPAVCNNVYAVSATDMQDQTASFSNYGTEMITRGLAAPGVELYTTDLNNGYASASGTSFSSPLAAGVAALVWSAKPSNTAAQVFDALKTSADDLGPAGPDRDYGWGRVNAYKAVCKVLPCRSYAAAEKKASAYPNPFRPASHRLVAFKTAAGFDNAGLEIKIYTAEGELVKKLAGLSWDGRNEYGAEVASGVYVFRVRTDSDSATGKFALLR
ncbi:MAG: S8 family serine peptidase [Elusimicrobiales bacterium]